MTPLPQKRSIIAVRRTEASSKPMAARTAPIRCVHNKSISKSGGTPLPLRTPFRTGEAWWARLKQAAAGTGARRARHQTPLSLSPLSTLWSILEEVSKSPTVDGSENSENGFISMAFLEVTGGGNDCLEGGFRMEEVMIPAMNWDLRPEGRASASPHIDFYHIRWIRSFSNSPKIHG